MKQSPFFWNTWLKDYRWIWNLSAAVFLFAILFLWFSYFQGASGVIDWVKLQEQKAIDIPVHSFQLGPFNLTVPGESYVILEYFQGSNIAPNTISSYIFLAGLVFSGLILLTVITTMEKFWYLIGTGLFILFLVSLRLEVLGIFGVYDNTPVIVVLILFVTLSFYFNRFKSTTSFVIRLAAFFGLTIVVGLIIHFFAVVGYPFYHLTLTGYTAGMVLSVLFIIIIAHEILAGFVYIVGQGSTKSLRHFSIISVIYMGNVIITCLHELGVIDWNFLYINVYLLLTISTVVGLWGFRQRETVYAHIFAFAPFGAYAFLALATICFVTTGQLLGNANDPGLKVIREAIIFSHVGYGIIFLTYIFSNYILMMARNMPVYKVLYTPNRMPYFTFRFGGMIATLAFVFYSNWHDFVFSGVAGFYNTTGDLYTLLDNPIYAESFYEKARLQGNGNNRSNYALATMRASRLSFDEAHLDYERANARRPTPYSLANAGNVYIWENDISQAIIEYKQAIVKLEGSSILENNLGFAYAKAHSLDSAVLFLNKAREDSYTKASAETNFFALAALEKIPLKTDSIIDLFGVPTDAVKANALALSTLQGQELKTQVQPLATRQLNLYSATLLNNYCIKYATSLDTTFINQAYAIASDSLNWGFSEALKSSLAFAFYHQGNVSKALEVLAELTYVTQNYKGKFNYTMGLWALEQHNPGLASDYFSYADTYDYKDARFYNAIALSEGGWTREATQAWDSVLRYHKGGEQVIALEMKRILTLDATAAISLKDPEKYQFCRYRIGVRDSVLFNRLINTFENADYKAQAILDLSRKYYQADQLEPAIRYLNRISGLELTSKELYEDVRHFELLMLAYRKETGELARQINAGITFNGSQRLEKLLYTALIAESTGDTTLAQKNFNVLARYNPYLEEGIVASSEYFKKHDRNKLRAYSILAEAIQINANSIRLLRAYVAEALRVGFDEYAFNASERLKALEEMRR